MTYLRSLNRLVFRYYSTRYKQFGKENQEIHTYSALFVRSFIYQLPARHTYTSAAKCAGDYAVNSTAPFAFRRLIHTCAV